MFKENNYMDIVSEWMIAAKREMSNALSISWREQIAFDEMIKMIFACTLSTCLVWFLLWLPIETVVHR